MYTDNENLIDCGASRMLVTGHWHFFRDTTGQGDYDTSRVDVEQMDRAAAGVEDNGEPFLVDIEVFDDDVDAMVENVRLALLRWKSAKPSRPIGIFRLVPRREFWIPVDQFRFHARQIGVDAWVANNNKVRQWKKHNRMVADQLLPLCDFVCPSVYALDQRYDHYWLPYADANIREAARVADGLPVWPIIQPVYPGNVPIQLEQWDRMVEMVAAHPKADSIVVYCPPPYEPADGWERPVLELMPDALDAEPSAVGQ